MKIHVYSEPGMASVNSYVIEGEAEVVVIDAQRSLSSAKRLLATVTQTGKPIAAIFLTHPHPDHFGGLPVLMQAQKEPIPLYALAQTRDALASGVNGLIAQSKQVLGDDFDENIPLPTNIVQSGDTLRTAGLHFHAENAGVGEAACMMMLYLPEEDTLFCADVVQHHMTAFLLEDHLGEWLQQIDSVSQKYQAVQKVYPGHGSSGTADVLFGFQRDYLQTFDGLVRSQQAGGKNLSPDGKKHVVREMNRLYPGLLPVAMIPDLLEKNVDAVTQSP